MRWLRRREPKVEVWPEIEWGRTVVGTCERCGSLQYEFKVCGLTKTNVMDLGAVAYCGLCDNLQTVIERWTKDVKEKIL